MNTDLHAEIAFWMMLMSLLVFLCFAYPAYKNLKDGDFDECNVATVFTALTFCVGILFIP